MSKQKEEEKNKLTLRKNVASWSVTKLIDVCKIYQPKTITKKEILPVGSYKVFGANGPIGFYHKYNHEKQEVLLTCRGATCGNINFSDKKSWITGNAMVVSPKDNRLTKKYLFYFLRNSNILKTITGTAQPQITKTSLGPFKILLPPISEQNQIVSILESAEKLKEKRQQANELLNELPQSIFIEMFGDPIKNQKKWKRGALKDISEIKRDSIPPEKIYNEKYIGLEHIESGTGKILKINHVSQGDLKSSKFSFNKDCILYGKLRPYLNKVALPNFDGICSTDILPIEPFKDKCNKYYLAFLLKHPHYIKLSTEFSTGANLPRINPKAIKRFRIPLPPIELQNKFQNFLEKMQITNRKVEKSGKEINQLFDALIQKAFNGELVS